MIEFDILGEPRPQGSKRAMVHRSSGKPVMIESGGKGLKLWRDRLRAVIQEKAPEGGPITGPVAVFCAFRLAVPKKPRWPYPIARNRNDLDKLARSILDELSGVLIEDDSQVVLLDVVKTYGTPGARIVVVPEAEWDMANAIPLSKESARVRIELKAMRVGA